MAVPVPSQMLVLVLARGWWCCRALVLADGLVLPVRPCAAGGWQLLGAVRHCGLTRVMVRCAMGPTRARG